ncbi:MAG: Serine/threonine kinase [Alectoria fallacina]|uniref:protein kinase C n=1 Tax=Alectoria fallacina TaxID=1903189 RepID=A0A8H3PI25_9LECA|nr:MAG: Serine/threonine kinase [Alectoria fallacina]
MNDDELINQVYRKIEREKVLINAANNMRQSSNPQVQQSLDSQIRESRKGIDYLEERMRELQMRRMEAMGSGSNGGPQPPAHGGLSPQQRGARNAQRSGGPTPPPRDGGAGYGQDSGDYGNPGNGGYMNDLSGGHGMMPPRAPFGPPGPGSAMPRTRPNYTKLDLIKYDTPYLGPRIQLMLSQLEFKLSVEKQYKDGVEKMVRLYQDEGDRKSKADAEARRIESNQKIQLLKQALKRYEDLHVDMESTNDAPDDDSLNSPNMRKPLTGLLSMTVHAVKDVDHAAIGRFARSPETFVVLKVEDTVKARTKSTRIDRWTDEVHQVDIDKANEIELTVYDKSGTHPTPIAMLWIRISDIAEEMRRKKIEADLGGGWATADRMDNQGMQNRQDSTYSSSQQSQGRDQRDSRGSSGQASYNAAQPPSNPGDVDAWFALEPVGRIQLTLSFTKQLKDRRPFDIGLNRKGAIRQRKEEVHELYGHKFVLQQFYNIMRCALCGEFLKYSAGMQCEDCKYTCHKKCYSKVVTKCISKSNAETDPDEEKLNHRIPHRFENFSNMGANWCCHCGYILPLGRKNKKCSECALSCHAQCAHLVPDFCGMSMEVANQILVLSRETKNLQGQRPSKPTNLSERTLRPSSGRPTPAPQPSYRPAPVAEQLSTPATDPRRSHGQEEQLYSQPPPAQQYGGGSGVAQNAAKNAAYSGEGLPQQRRPQQPPRSASSQAAIDAASKVMGVNNKRLSSARSNTTTDFSSLAGTPGASYPSMDDGLQQPPQATYNPKDYAGYGGYPSQAPPTSVAQPQQQQPSYQEPTRTLQQSQQVVKAQPASEAAPQQGMGRRIGLEHFNFLAVLGKGNFGKVMLAETKATKKLYAIKVLKKEFIIENDEVESTKSEKRVFLIANKERHPFLLNLHACFQTETRVYFVMEYISGGDLMLHIQRGQFGSKRAQFYAAEVCLALKYFHENGVIYRDLKLDNIMLTLDGHIKVADYGLCKEEMWYGSSTSTFCGTPEFMAPEILLDKKYGRAVDWWAFGVLIYQMLLQQSPFRGEDEDEIYDAILADEPLYPIHMPRDSVSVLQKLLMREPELRLGSGPTDAQEIMSHAFFRNINWDDIRDKKVAPPFQPQIKNPTDTSNFDSEFTSVTPVLTPVQSVLTQAMQEEFRGFSYSADFI